MAPEASDIHHPANAAVAFPIGLGVGLPPSPDTIT